VSMMTHSPARKTAGSNGFCVSHITSRARRQSELSLMGEDKGGMQVMGAYFNSAMVGVK